MFMWTPEPWEVEHETDEEVWFTNAFRIRSGHTAKTIAWIGAKADGPDPEAEANVALFIAAPKLARKLREIAEKYHYQGEHRLAFEDCYNPVCHEVRILLARIDSDD